MIALAAGALAQGVEPRNQVDPEQLLSDILLDLSTRGASADVAARLLQLSRDLAVNEPVRIDVLYWLGQVDERRGNVDEARATLLDGIRTGRCEGCRLLYQEIEIARRAAGRPTTWTFDEDATGAAREHGVFHPTAVEGLGSIRLTAADDGASVLAWATERSGAAPDRLVIGLRDGMDTLELVARAVDRPVAIAVAVEDLQGHRFASRTTEVHADRWSTIEVRVGELGHPDGLKLRPGDARRVEIVEVPWGPEELATLWFDAVSIR